MAPLSCGVSSPEATKGGLGRPKEVVGGYMVIAAESYERAVQVARECPGVIGPESSVEIREIAGG